MKGEQPMSEIEWNEVVMNDVGKYCEGPCTVTLLRGCVYKIYAVVKISSFKTSGGRPQAVAYEPWPLDEFLHRGQHTMWRWVGCKFPFLVCEI